MDSDWSPWEAVTPPAHADLERPPTFESACSSEIDRGPDLVPTRYSPLRYPPLSPSCADFGHMPWSFFGASSRNLPTAQHASEAIWRPLPASRPALESHCAGKRFSFFAPVVIFSRAFFPFSLDEPWILRNYWGFFSMSRDPGGIR